VKQAGERKSLQKKRVQKERESLKKGVHQKKTKHDQGKKRLQLCGNQKTKKKKNKIRDTGRLTFIKKGKSRAT